MLASSTGLFVGRVGEMKKLHIRTVSGMDSYKGKPANSSVKASFGTDNPRRIIYEPSLHAYGVAFIRTEPTRVGNYEPSRSSFKLIDDNNLTGKPFPLYSKII